MPQFSPPTITQNDFASLRDRFFQRSSPVLPLKQPTSSLAGYVAPPELEVFLNSLPTAGAVGPERMRALRRARAG